MDRGLCNLSWLDRWLNTDVLHAPVVASDHSPIVLRCEPNQTKAKKRFRFEALWAKEEDCRRLIETCWHRVYHGDPVQCWHARLNVCRSRLLQWSKGKFNWRVREIDDLLDQLQELQMDWGTNAVAIQEKTMLLDRLREQEETFWQQRSRVKWLREGDANTTFFHQPTLQRRRRNKIEMIKRDDGEWEQNPTRVHHLFDKYFIKLFTTSGPRDWA